MQQGIFLLAAAAITTAIAGCSCCKHTSHEQANLGANHVHDHDATESNAHSHDDEEARDRPTNSDSDAPAMSFVRDLPDTTEYVRLLAEPEALSLHSGLVTLQPGEDCGWHSTGHYEEMIICLEGHVELASETGPRIPLIAGQYGYNPPHTRHCVFNTSDTPMRYIYIVAPTEG